jgi:hypothetical protein
MRERPIIFSAGMISALLNGEKTQTRRVIRFPKRVVAQDFTVRDVCEDGGGNWVAWEVAHPDNANFTKKAYPNGEGFRCPYGKRGDRLWVKETWVQVDYDLMDVYRADCDAAAEDAVYKLGFKWTPAIFMPRRASRITLEIADVRAQRLQDIATEDAVAEGCPGCRPDLPNSHAVAWYSAIWNGLNAKRGLGWDTNPWVWALTFRRIS